VYWDIEFQTPTRPKPYCGWNSWNGILLNHMTDALKPSDVEPPPTCPFINPTMRKSKPPTGRNPALQYVEEWNFRFAMSGATALRRLGVGPFSHFSIGVNRFFGLVSQTSTLAVAQRETRLRDKRGQAKRSNDMAST
jgi:hypothetical protein